jgi:integrase
MRGHINTRKLSDGSLRYDVVFDAPRGGDGRRRQITKTFASKRDADRALTELMRSVDVGNFHESRITVSDYLASWLKGKASLRPTTGRSYEAHIRLYLQPHLGRLRLSDLRAHHIETMFERIRASNGTRERPLGPTTLKRIHATLMSALQSAVKRRLIPYNPALHIELESVRRVETDFWLPHEVAKFLGEIQADDLFPMIHLMVYRGLRRGEAIGLLWKDVDLDRGHLRVNQQIVQLGHATAVGPPKSSQSIRAISLDHRTVTILRSHRASQAALRLAAGDSWIDDGYVFTRADGQHYHPGYVTKHFGALVRASSVPTIRLHDLRHTSATLGLAAGESMKEISARLGHSSIVITSDIYSHVSETMAEASAEKVANLIATATQSQMGVRNHP